MRRKCKDKGQGMSGIAVSTEIVLELKESSEMRVWNLHKRLESLQISVERLISKLFLITL